MFFWVSLGMLVVGMVSWIGFDRRLNRLLIRHDPDYGEVQAVRQESRASLSSPHPVWLAVYDALFRTTARFRRAGQFQQHRPVARTVRAGRSAMLVTLAGAAGLVLLLFNEILKEISQ